MKKINLFYLDLAALCISLIPLANLLAYLWVVLRFSSLFKPKTNSALFRVTLSLLVVSAITQIAGIILWFFDKNYSAIPLITILALMPVILHKFFTRFNISDEKKLITKVELVALVTCLVLTISTFAPSLIRFGLASTVVGYTNIGFDDATHLSLLKTSILSGGYTYGFERSRIKGPVFDSLQGYPLGWHVSQAYWMNVLGRERVSDARTFVVLYFIIKISWFFLAIFCFALFAINLLNKTKKKLSHYAATAALFLTLGIAYLHFFIPSLAMGFINFIGSSAFVVMAGLLLIGGYTKDNRIFRVASLLIAISIPLMWLLLLPISIAIIVAICVDELKKDTNRKRRIRTLLTYALCGIFSFAQLYIQLRFSDKSSPLNEAGGIQVINSQVMFILLVNMALCAYCYLNSKHRVDILRFMSLLSAVVVLPAGIYIYQQITTGLTSYFYHKTLYVLLIVAIGFLVVPIIELLLTIKSIWRLYDTVVVTAFSISLLIILLPYDFSNFKKIINGRFDVSPQVRPVVWDLLNNTNATNTGYAVKRYKSFAEDVLTTRYMRFSLGVDRSCDQKITEGRITGSISMIKEGLDGCEREYADMVLISSSQTPSELIDVDNIKSRLTEIKID